MELWYKNNPFEIVTFLSLNAQYLEMKDTGFI